MILSDFIVTSIISFLIGSIPTAFILVKRMSGRDLRTAGSGNIGAYNAYDVTHSKRIGVYVLLLDLLKGAMPIFMVHFFFGTKFWLLSIAIICVVLGHNYSPWLKFRGGRGLAPAAGASLLFNPLLLLFWLFFWSVGYWKSRDIPFSNIAATVFSPILLAFTPGLVMKTSLVHYESYNQFLLASSILFLLIFVKHLKPLRDLVTKYKQN